MVRSATEAPSSLDVPSRLVTNFRGVTEAPTVSESIVSPALHPRSTTEAPTLSESAVRRLARIRTVADSPTVSDNLGTVRDFVRTVVEGVMTPSGVLGGPFTYDIVSAIVALPPGIIAESVVFEVVMPMQPWVDELQEEV